MVKINYIVAYVFLGLLLLATVITRLHAEHKKQLNKGKVIQVHKCYWMKEEGKRWKR